MTIEDVLARLTAGLDRDEAIARAACPGPWSVDDENYVETMYDKDKTAIISGGRWGGEAPVFDCNDDAAHILRHDPARVLRQVEAIRLVIADYHDAREALNGLNDSQLGWEERARVNALESTLSALAGIYTDTEDGVAE